jgi:hypothetical protein
MSSPNKQFAAVITLRNYLKMVENLSIREYQQQKVEMRYIFK